MTPFPPMVTVVANPDLPLVKAAEQIPKAAVSFRTADSQHRMEAHPHSAARPALASAMTSSARRHPPFLGHGMINSCPAEERSRSKTESSLRPSPGGPVSV